MVASGGRRKWQFRSSFRDWCFERANFPHEIVEPTLVKSAVEGAYQRGDVLAKRARMMEAWADFCTTPRESRVVPLRVA
jgi:hypothetical protein